MDLLILFASAVLLIYLLTRKWFWIAMLVLFAIGLLFTPLAGVVAIGILVAAGFVVLHLVFMLMMFVLSTLFLFS